MRSYSRKRKNNIIIGSLLGVMLLMTVGYAAFNSVLKIKGASGISSNWDVRITNVVSKNVVGGATNAKEPTFEALTASMETNLESPKDSIEYDITVTNNGTINAKLDKINLTDSNNPAIKFTTSGLTEGTKLKVGESAVLTIKVEYLDGVSVDPNNMSSTLTVTLEYSQSNINNEGIAVPELSASEMLTENIVTTGDGLYEDTTEAGRYIYRGANPNNYIYIKEKNGTEDKEVLYRIISIESDGTLKIMKQNNQANRAFEEAYTRTATYCNENGYGCNVWGSSKTMLNNALENVTTMPRKVNGTAYALPTAESQMAIYLNTTYYNTLSDDSKAIVDNHIWNVGPVDATASKDLGESLTEESAYKWRGKVGLIYPTDYVKASTNSSCTTINSGLGSNNRNCRANNYLQASHNYWTMSPSSSNNSGFVWIVNRDGYLTTSAARDTSIYISDNRSLYPVLYLTPNITLSGEGTSENPYTINS